MRRLLPSVAAAAVCAWVPRAPAVTVSNIVAAVHPASYAYYHTNLFVADGNNRGFESHTVASIPRLPAFDHDPARDFIFFSFSNLALNVELDPFSFTKAYTSVTYTYSNCHNVVAIKPGVGGADHGYFIIGAHYDSVDTGQGAQKSPGADDNASGVAGILEAARVLSPFTFRDTLVFIAFDAEEKGLKGAYHFVADSTTADPAETNRIYRGDVRSAISLDMIAYNPPGDHVNKARVYGGSGDVNAPVRSNLTAALTAYTELSVLNAGVTGASDHYPFKLNGMDACLLIEHEVWSNPWYHKATDSVDTPGNVDYAYAAKMTRGVVGYLCHAAGLIPPATLLTEPAADGGAFVLQWDSLPGLAHAVEYNEAAIAGGGWRWLYACTNLDGAAVLSVTDQVGAVRQRLYRVNTWRPEPPGE